VRATQPPSQLGPSWQSDDVHSGAELPRAHAVNSLHKLNGQCNVVGCRNSRLETEIEAQIAFNFDHPARVKSLSVPLSLLLKPTLQSECTVPVLPHPSFHLLGSFSSTTIKFSLYQHSLVLSFHYAVPARALEIYTRSTDLAGGGAVLLLLHALFHYMARAYTWII